MDMNPLEKMVNYAYVGLIPNAVAGLCAWMDAPRITEDLSNGHYVRAFFVSLPGLMNLFVGYLKYAEYAEVKSSLQQHGWDSRIVKPKMYSWCQRHAARQAARQTGYAPQFEAFSQREGHRWYHFLPKMHRFGEVAGR